MTQLALTARTLADLGWDKLLHALAARTQTPWGQELALAVRLLPDAAAVEHAWAETQEARQLLRRALTMPVGGLEDIRPHLDRADKGAVLGAPELFACVNVARAASQVKRFVVGLAEDVPLLASKVQRFADLSALAARVSKTFEPSGALRDDASYDLAEYRRRARSLHARMKGRLDELLAEPEFTHRLQDNYYSLRNDRYVVPVKSNFRGQVPGIVHNASQSGQTIFVELDELVPLGNELTIAESLAAEEERRILAELSREVASSQRELLANAELLAELDRLQAVARLADDLNCEVPELVAADAPMVLRDARHPILLLQGKKVVPNTITLAAGAQALVISGPNAGGKTVAMSTVGLCLLMTRAGLPIPAREGTAVPLVDGLSCAIGDAQDLARDLSSFTAHLQSLAEILAAAGRGWLCLVDEIASDTDPVEGAALACAILEGLADRGARLVVTTHLEQVKAFGINDQRFVNAKVGLDPSTLRPSYALELGSAGVSKAIDVAAQAGLPESVIAKAREYLRGGGALTLALQKLDDQHQALVAERDALQKRMRALEQEQVALAAEVEKMRQARAVAEVELKQKVAERFAQASSEAAAVIASLQAGATMQTAQRAQREMAERADGAREEANALAKAPMPHGASKPQARPAVGSRVKVLGLNQIGEVITLDDTHAVVACGSLRTRVALSDVTVLSARDAGVKAERQKQKREHRRSLSAATHSGGPDVLMPSATCDVRGLRADEALRQIELFLDQRYLEGQSPLLLIHGHGTGALRQVVREALSGSSYVAQFRPGDDHEGGDGVTVVDLRL
jgi:DNA mismatch repair protein MutS2